MTKEDRESLEKLKKDYIKIQEKHNLPSFERLNEDFSIEKIAEYETDILIREVRKYTAEKLSNYLRFIEAIVNPVNSQPFIFSIISSINQEDKKRLNEMYKKLAKNEVRLIETDVSFSEAKEAEFIKKAYETWQEIKKDLLEVIDSIKRNWDNKTEGSNKGYFG
ncbi:MAG TPA: hypothetical protein VMC80_01940 [Patescibacteria group bacterium]|nr:hypothetical protein [Patescibacteria group bacterium]